MKRYAALLLVLILLAFTGSALAQDASTTDEPVAVETEIVVATETETSFVTPTEIVATVTESDFVTPTSSPTPTHTPTPDFTPTPAPPPVDPAPTETGSSSIIVIIISILTLVLGGGTAIAMLSNFRKDAAGVAATEALGKSVPQELAMKLVDLLQGARTAADIAIEALDNVPAASKPAAIAQFTIEELIAEVTRRGYKVSAV